MKKTLAVILFSISYLVVSTVLTFPGQLISGFNYFTKDNSISVFWDSENEESVSKYILEYSIDNKEFHKIKTILPDGNGNKYTVNDPNFKDNKSKLIYYRITILNDTNFATYKQVLTYAPSISILKQSWDGINTIFR